VKKGKVRKLGQDVGWMKRRLEGGFRGLTEVVGCLKEVEGLSGHFNKVHEVE
jgi:hypothetical protein